MPTLLTPERLPFLLLVVGFAIFQTSRRNMEAYRLTAVSATLYAALEILAQAAVLGLLLYGFITLIALVYPGRLGAFIGLLLTVALGYRPTKQISSTIENYLLQQYGLREK